MKKILDWFTEKKVCVIMLAVFAVSVIPLLILAKYNVISCDDFNYGSAARRVLENGGSVASVLKAALAGTKWSYFNWQGTFTAIFAMRLNPMVFSEGLSCLTPYIMLGALTAGIGFFSCELFNKCLKASAAKTMIIAVMWLFISVQFVPDASQAFYWYNGSFYYTFFYSVSLFLYGLILRTLREEKVSAARIIAGTMISVFIGGGNYVTALTSLMIVFLALAYSCRTKNLKRIISLAIWALCLSAAFIISVKAPGNAVRQATFATPNPIKAIAMAIFYAVTTVIGVVPTPVPFLLLLLVPALYDIAKNSGLSFRYPLLVHVFTFLLYAAQDTPTWYAMWGPGATRVTAILFYSLIFLLIFNMFYLLGYIARKSEAKGKEIVFGKRKTAAFGAALIIFGGGVALLNPTPKIIGFLEQYYPNKDSFMVAHYEDYYPNSTTTAEDAIRSLVSGEAQTYHSEYLERKELLETDEKSVKLKPYSVEPKLLFIRDATDDSEYWINRAMADWYEKDEIVVSE